MPIQDTGAVSFVLDLQALNCAVNKEQGWSLYLCVALEAHSSCGECCVHWAWLFLASPLIFSFPLGSS